MTLRYTNALFGIVPIAFLSNCSTNTNGTVIFDPPHCRITQQSAFKGKSSGSFPSISFTILNDGENNPAYNAGVSVKLKNGNTIIDEGFSSTSVLQKGESVIKEVDFTKVQSQSEFNVIAVRLYWYDYDNGFYESNQ